MKRFAAFLAVTAITSLAALPAAGDDSLPELAKKRATLRTYHRSMGITTWISMAATTTLGTIRYANVIGFGAPLCDPGGGAPILGRTWGCGDGLMIQHLVSASVTTGSYVAARTLAGLMPDPYGAADGDRPGAAKLRVHRALSWVHLVGMIATPILGFVTSAASEDSRRTLATIHLASGYVTFAAVSTAAAIMVF